MLGIGATGVIFGAARYFARGPPQKTMNREYQEASDEYLKVSRDQVPLILTISLAVAHAYLLLGPKRRAHHRYLFRRLQGRLHGSEQACKQVNLHLTLDKHNKTQPPFRNGCSIPWPTHLSEIGSTPRKLLLCRSKRRLLVLFLQRCTKNHPYQFWSIIST